MRRRERTTAAVLGWALALAACGGPREVDAAPPPAAMEASAEVGAAPPETAGAGTAEPAIPPPETPPPQIAPSIPRDDLMGRIDPARHADFVRIPAELADSAGYFGRREAVAAFARMHEAARADGVELRIISAFRSFDRQKTIWEEKWTGRRPVEGARADETTPDLEARARLILRFSAMPGASRHHWGTDFDLNSLDNAWFARSEGARVHAWLTARAGEFGFCQVYSEKGPARPDGYEEERWHWSYMPAAGSLLAAYTATLGDADIAGFEGAGTAGRLGVVERYVKGINPEC